MHLSVNAMPCTFSQPRYDSDGAPLCWPPLEFLRVELSPSSDGFVFVALTATVLDPDEPQLLDQEIVSDKVATLDQLLQLLRTYVRITAQEAAPSRPLN